MIFDLDLSGLGASVSSYLASLGPWFYVVGGLVVAGGIVSWAIGLLRDWQAEREDWAYIAEMKEKGWINDDLTFTEEGLAEYRLERFGKLHYDDPDPMTDEELRQMGWIDDEGNRTAAWDRFWNKDDEV